MGIKKLANLRCLRVSRTANNYTESDPKVLRDNVKHWRYIVWGFEAQLQQREHHIYDDIHLQKSQAPFQGH